MGSLQHFPSRGRLQAVVPLWTHSTEIRAQLSAMAPRRAIAYIRSFDLPPDEAASLIECDVRGRSCVQAAELLHLSVDGLAKLRRRAYRKIADGQNESTD